MGVGAAIVGSAIVGAYASKKSSDKAASASKDAARTQAASTDRATELQREIYYQNREDMAPWRTAGVGALGQLQSELGNYAGYIKDPSTYLQSPGYNWLVQQGVDAIDRGASATGKLDSGQRSKDLMAYGQGLASQDYGNFLGRYGDLLNRYSGIAGTGQTASSAMGSYGQNYANQAGQNMIAGGNAQAAGMINAANANTGMWSNLSQIGSNAANQYMMYNYLNRNTGSTTANTGVYSLPDDIANFNPSYSVT
jgi:hypothetical protein